MKKIIFALLAATFFVSQVYAQQDLALAKVQTNISSDLIRHFEMFISNQSTEMNFQIDEQTVERRQMLEEVSELAKLASRMDGNDKREIFHLKGKAKGRLIYLLHRVRDINDAMGEDKISGFLDFTTKKDHMPSSRSQSEIDAIIKELRLTPAEYDRIETVVALSDTIKLRDIAQSTQAISRLKTTLLEYSVLEASGQNKLLIQYRTAARLALFQSLFAQIQKLNDDQVIKLMENIFGGKANVNKGLYSRMKQHLEKIILKDLDANELYEKFEFIIKSETADIIELADLPISTEGVRRERSKWRELVKADLAQYKEGSTETPSARLTRVLKIALKLK